MQATNFLFVNCFFIAEEVAFNLDGECAKSLYTAELAVFLTSSKRIDAPLKLAICKKQSVSVTPKSLQTNLAAFRFCKLWFPKMISSVSLTVVIPLSILCIGVV
jgi:hypothetical protein